MKDSRRIIYQRKADSQKRIQNSCYQAIYQELQYHDIRIFIYRKIIDKYSKNLININILNIILYYFPLRYT